MSSCPLSVHAAGQARTVEKLAIVGIAVLPRFAASRRVAASRDTAKPADLPASHAHAMPARMSAPRVEIRYCPRCHWLLRAAWLAQELLSTFENELGEVALVPVRDVAGTLAIVLDGETLFDRKQAGHFPEPKHIKQLVRDRVAPGRSLGHVDR